MKKAVYYPININNNNSNNNNRNNNNNAGDETCGIIYIYISCTMYTNIRILLGKIVV